VADNVVITPGSGATVAADEVTDATLGTVKVQMMKIMDGTLDGTQKAAVGDKGLQVDSSVASRPIVDLLTSILTEMRVMNAVLQAGLNVRDDLDVMRADPYYATSILQ
jgi:hypothetical protein